MLSFQDKDLEWGKCLQFKAFDLEVNGEKINTRPQDINFMSQL